ncbi:MAG: DUF6164 family protein [Granulosicoccaceae bacterium]
MPILLFKLNQVPLDEAQEVRDLLHDQQVPFYETSQGFWGFSLGGIWLADDQLHQQSRAEQLIAEYQRQRQQEAREAYQPRGLLTAIIEKPLRLVLLTIVLLVLYFSISPFIRPLLF